MIFPLLFFLGVGGVLALTAASAQKAGTRPLDVLPPEAKGPPAQVAPVTASSGRSYVVQSWRPARPAPDAPARAYYVAKLKGPPNIWIAYWFEPESKGRLFARGRAESRAQLRAMLSDFNVQETAAAEGAIAA